MYCIFILFSLFIYIIFFSKVLVGGKIYLFVIMFNQILSAIGLYIETFLFMSESSAKHWFDNIEIILLKVNIYL